MHPTAIATVSLSSPLPEKLRAIAVAGFTAIELFEDDVLRYPGSLSSIKALCDELNLAIILYQPFRDLEGSRDFPAALQRLRQKLEWMQELGCDMILVVSNCQADAHAEFGRWVEECREAAALAEGYGVRIVYEALAWGTHVNLWEQSWELVKAVDRLNFGLCLDSFHIFSRHDSIERICQVPGDKIFIVQLADALDMKLNDVLEWSRHYRNFPGQGGKMPVLEFMQELKKTGFRGLLSLEVFSDNFRNVGALETAKDGMRSLKLLQTQVYGTAMVPEVPPHLGIEFLEFAVAGNEAQLLEVFFLQLGFRKVGSHRSKNVQWFNNGSASLVLNGELDSHAASHHSTNGGLSLCALALRVDDAPSVIRRAEAIGYEVVPSQILGLQAGEANITAVKTPDDLLVYLVDNDSFWGKDFLVSSVVPAEASVESLYTGVDNITFAMAAEKIESLTLCYTALFGAQCTKELDIHDHYGLTKAWDLSVASQLRFLLTTSQSSKSHAGRIMSTGGVGSALHAVALHTPDIFTTLASLTSSELFCNVSDRYYDDLKFKYGLSDAFVEKLHSARVLYEEAPNGCGFLTAFTAPVVAGKFYFQIVQRLDAYQGLGILGLAHQMAVHHQRLQSEHQLSHALLAKMNIELEVTTNRNGHALAKETRREYAVVVDG